MTRHAALGLLAVLAGLCGPSAVPAAAARPAKACTPAIEGRADPPRLDVASSALHSDAVG
jgi:hypothetical protein